MANFDTIKTAIDANINTNGNQAITGGKMNSILKQMVDATGEPLAELESELTKLNAILFGQENKSVFIGSEGWVNIEFPFLKDNTYNIKLLDAPYASECKILDVNGNTIQTYATMYPGQTRTIINLSQDGSSFSTYIGGAGYLNISVISQKEILNDIVQTSQKVDNLGFSLITSSSTVAVKPNIDTSLMVLDLGDDPIVVYGKKSYVLKNIHTDISQYRSIPLRGNSSTAQKLYFNTEDATFKAVGYADSLDFPNILIGSSRIISPINCEFNLPFSFTINKKDIWKVEYKSLNCKTSIDVIAHRGFHLNGPPENSLDSARFAGRLGYRCVECDIIATKDGELVLMHDSSINRTMRMASDYSAIKETINVSEHLYRDLRNNYVLASEDRRMRRPIPTLEEFFITCRECDLFPLVELKNFGITTDDILKAHNLGLAICGEGNFGFTSFNNEYLDYARSLSDKTIIAYIIAGGIVGTTNSITNKERVSPTTWWYPTWDYSNYGNYGLTKENIERHRKAGVKVYVWTVPVNKFDELLKLGVDGYATDYISPNINGLVGHVATTDLGFMSFKSDGIQEQRSLILSAGQKCEYYVGSLGYGGYYLSIIAKGNIRIIAPNLDVSVSAEDYERFIYQGVVNYINGDITIIANEDSEIQFVEYSCVEFS